MIGRQLEFVAVGPKKTATTWLDACLRGHPALCLPERTKETFFFDEEFERGFGWYWSHFETNDPARKCGEVAPSYFEVAEAISRLHALNPSCRIIVSLRDPAARAFSSYLHEKRRGTVRASFVEATIDSPGIIDGSRYATHLPKWIEAFGRERVLVIFQDEVARCPESLLDNVWGFLGVESPGRLAEAERMIYPASSPRLPALARIASRAGRLARRFQLFALINAAKRVGADSVFRGGPPLPELDAETRAVLVEKFESDIAYVEGITSRRLDSWRRIE